MVAVKCPHCGYVEPCPKCNGGMCSCCGNDIPDKESVKAQ